MNPRAASTTALVLVPFLAAAQAPPRPTPRPPTFEVGIEVINLNVSITDARNRYVTDLLEKNFAVFEDGVRQDLTLFSHENLPISLVLMMHCSASTDDKLQVAPDTAVGCVQPLSSQALPK